jgi:tetratricopeptide (TPR) repeat protein
MAKKIKLSKKEMKKRDEFLTTTDRALAFLVENGRGALAVLVAIILVLVSGFGIRYWLESRHEAAATSMTEALAVLNLPLTQDLTDEQILAGVRSFDTEDQRLRQAGTGLDEMIKSHSSSEVAREAHYYLAGVYYQLEEYDNALEQYDAFLDMSGATRSDPIFKSLIIFNQACCYFNLGNYEKALEYYRMVIENKDAPNRPEALVNAAWCEENLNNHVDAIAYLEQARDEYPDASSVRGITYKIKSLEEKKEKREKEEKGEKPEPSHEEELEE